MKYMNHVILLLFASVASNAEPAGSIVKFLHPRLTDLTRQYAELEVAISIRPPRKIPPGQVCFEATHIAGVPAFLPCLSWADDLPSQQWSDLPVALKARVYFADLPEFHSFGDLFKTGSLHVHTEASTSATLPFLAQLWMGQSVADLRVVIDQEMPVVPDESLMKRFMAMGSPVGAIGDRFKDWVGPFLSASAKKLSPRKQSQLENVQSALAIVESTLVVRHKGQSRILSHRELGFHIAGRGFCLLHSAIEPYYYSALEAALVGEGKLFSKVKMDRDQSTLTIRPLDRNLQALQMTYRDIQKTMRRHKVRFDGDAAFSGWPGDLRRVKFLPRESASQFLCFEEWSIPGATSLDAGETEQLDAPLAVVYLDSKGIGIHYIKIFEAPGEELFRMLRPLDSRFLGSPLLSKNAVVGVVLSEGKSAKFQSQLSRTANREKR